MFLRLFVCFCICCISHLALAAPLFEDDGTGTNPGSGIPNNWNLGPGWQVNVTMAQIASYPEYAGSAAVADLSALLGPDNPLIIAELTANGDSMATVGPVLASGNPLLTLVASAQTLPVGTNRVTYIFDSFNLSQNEVDGSVSVDLQSPTFILSNVGIGSIAADPPKTDGQDDYWVAVTAKPMIHKDLKVFAPIAYGVPSQFQLSTGNSVSTPVSDFTDLDGVKRIVTLAIVPEPSTLILLIGVLMGGLRRLRR